MHKKSTLKRLLREGVFWAITLVTVTGLAFAQTPVAFAPPLHFQFFTTGGQPLANGKIYTYQGGTTTCANTYVDATGTTQNPCPILLDSTGSPSNGSNQVGIFLSNQTWKFVAYDANNVLQWSVDNVTTYFALLNTANTWSAVQTFSVPLIDSATDNQIILGAPGNQTTLDAPPPAGNVTLHLPNTSDTLVGRNTTDTLTNKTLTAPNVTNGNFNSPTIATPTINGVFEPSGPATYLLIANATSTGTNLNSLTKLVNAPSQALIAATTDTAGIVGICVSNCSTSGNAVIQASGQTSCLFDGGVVAGDYVTISSTVPGDCHDAGASYPTGSQVIGRAVSTNVAAGNYFMLLYGSDVKIPAGTGTQITNAAVTGTTLNTLTKLTGAPSTAVITSTSDIGGVIGITTAGAGTSGSANILQSGVTLCVFDGATVAGHYVQISSTSGGNCHDAGAAYPVSGQVVGRVLSTNGSGGSYQVDLFSPEIQSGVILNYSTGNYGGGTIAGSPSTTTLVTKSITMPASGCPCRVLATWSTFWATTNAGEFAAWVSDGTNPFATASTSTAGSSTHFGLAGSGTSLNTYANGASVTFTLVASQDAGGTVTVNANSGVGAATQSNYLNLDLFPAAN